MPNKEKDKLREAKIKAARFCTYRERAPLEVREKLVRLGLMGRQLEQTLNDLVSEGFLNERRFAASYANGRLRLKKWGRLKIKRGLESYQLDPQCIYEALESLPEEDYQNILRKHIVRKNRAVKVEDPFIRKHRIAQFVISKGFEPELVWSLLKEDNFG